MFKVKKEIIIAQDEEQYISFPDIIQSIIDPDTYFIVYRTGDNHHPTWSKLVIQKSEDKGKTWKIVKEFLITLEESSLVWNCPRLSYMNKKLYIICDAKSGIIEKIAQFKTFFLISEDEGESWEIKETPLPGMVPDKFISFKDKIFCANHKIKNDQNQLIQLISWSRDKETWYDTNVVAHSLTKQFCEASVVNMGDYLISYLRDNSGHCKNIYTVTSKDGINWTIPKRLSIVGQRVTALKDGDNIIGAYRNTSCEDVFKRYISMFEHNLKTGRIKTSDIDWERTKNQYHYGYTGMAKVDENSYLVASYIKQKALNPFIKLYFVERS